MGCMHSINDDKVDGEPVDVHNVLAEAAGKGEILEGFLYRKSREGKWKKRWYCTREESGWWILLYLRDQFATTVLNAIKLHRTSSIEICDEEGEEHGLCFALVMESNQRYVHKAATKAATNRWVSVLNGCRDCGIEQRKKNMRESLDLGSLVGKPTKSDNDVE